MKNRAKLVKESLNEFEEYQDPNEIIGMSFKFDAFERAIEDYDYSQFWWGELRLDSVDYDEETFTILYSDQHHDFISYVEMLIVPNENKILLNGWADDYSKTKILRVKNFKNAEQFFELLKTTIRIWISTFNEYAQTAYDKQHY